MRYPASEKHEIIRIVEKSHLPARRTLEQLGIPRATFHRWYDRFLTGGVEALDDRSPRLAAQDLVGSGTAFPSPCGIELLT